MLTFIGHMPHQNCSILSLAPYRILPATTGGHLGIVSLHDHLGRICEDHIIGTVDNGSEEAYSFELHRLFPASPLRYLPGFQLRKIAGLGRRFDAAWIYCDHPYMAPTAMGLSKKLGIPWFLRSHNIEAERFRSLGRKWWRLMYTYEQFAMRHADGIFFITPNERLWAISQYGLQPGKCHFIPYGTELAAPPEGREQARTQLAGELGLDPAKPWLYFLGALSYLPNEQAVHYLLQEVAPRLIQSGADFELLIAGKGLSAELQQQISQAGGPVRYTGFIPELDTFLNACDLMLNPVLTGGGIKTKAVEALGYSKTVISTASGAEGILPEVCGQNLLITPDGDWEAFSRAVISRQHERHRTPEAFYQTYYWGHIAARVMDIMQSVKPATATGA